MCFQAQQIKKTLNHPSLHVGFFRNPVNYCKNSKENQKTEFFWVFVYKKIAILRNMLSIQHHAISLVAMSSKELWLVQENHTCKTLIECCFCVELESSVASLSNLYQVSLLMEFYISQTKCWKCQGSFVIRAALWVEELWGFLEYWRS